jgi:signal peptidase I
VATHRAPANHARPCPRGRRLGAYVRPVAAVLAYLYLSTLVSLALCALLPLALGWHSTVVMSGSMEPNIATGDILAAQPASGSDVLDGRIKAGMVVLAEDPMRPGTMYTHRVAMVLPDGGLVTKGDANATPDPVHLVPGSVQGIEMLRIPYLGIPLQAARTGNVVPATGLVVLTVLAVMIVRDERRLARPRRLQQVFSTRAEARKARLGSRGIFAAFASRATGIVAMLLALLAGSTAAFTGWAGTSGNTMYAAAYFPVPAVSGKPLRFGVAEPLADPNELDRVAREVNEYPSLSQYYRDFSAPLDMNLIAQTISKGATPVVTLEPWIASTGGTNQPDFKLSTITSGAHDAYLNSVADQLNSAGNPHIFLRFAHEMNGSWYPWAEQVNGNQPGDYVAAWKHVHDLFTAKAVTNLDWVWAPNAPGAGLTDMAELYPGSAYVDHTAVDGFNWGSTLSWSTWQHPWDVLDPGLDNLQQVAPDKNIIVTETASAESDGSNTKSQWILDLVYNVNHWGDGKAIRVIGLIWFDINKETFWRLDNTASSYAAMKDALASR